MRLVVIRHAIAEDKPAERSDLERKLTEEGIRKMRKGARGIATLVPALKVLHTSPAARALETAEIVRAAYAGIELHTCEPLLPGAPVGEVVGWLDRQEEDSTIAIVGHEPQLSTLVGQLLAGRARSLIELKKGAACLLSRATREEPWRLEWALSPKALRGLG